MKSRWSRVSSSIPHHQSSELTSFQLLSSVAGLDNLTRRRMRLNRVNLHPPSQGDWIRPQEKCPHPRTGVLLPTASTLRCCPSPSPLHVVQRDVPDQRAENIKAIDLLASRGTQLHRGLSTDAVLTELLFGDGCCREDRQEK